MGGGGLQVRVWNQQGLQAVRVAGIGLRALGVLSSLIALGMAEGAPDFLASTVGGSNRVLPFGMCL